MTHWMKRRIERSRARCEKTATNNRTDKDEEPGKPPKLDGDTPLESNGKGN